MAGARLLDLRAQPADTRVQRDAHGRPEQWRSREAAPETPPDSAARLVTMYPTLSNYEN